MRPIDPHGCKNAALLVCRGEVEAQPASSRADEEQEMRGLGVELVAHAQSVPGGGGPIQPGEDIAAAGDHFPDDSQHAHRVAEYEHLHRSIQVRCEEKEVLRGTRAGAMRAKGGILHG